MAWLAANGMEGVRTCEMQPDQVKTTRNGAREQCASDGRTIVVFHADGRVTTRENRIQSEDIHLKGERPDHVDIRELEAKLRAANPGAEGTLNERVIQAWINAKNVPRARERDARNMAPAALRQVAPNRNFATYTPDDIRRLV